MFARPALRVEQQICVSYVPCQDCLSTAWEASLGLLGIKSILDAGCEQMELY